MSDRAVSEVLDQLEILLGGILARPDGQAIADWHQRFRTAVAAAERGPEWPGILARARDLGVLLDQQTTQLQAAQKAVRWELEKGALGQRALKGYRTL
jgi:hypothetical protein